MSTTTVSLTAGDRVKFRGDGNRWWDVRVADERYAICTRQEAFRPKGELRYTIVDAELGIRGAVNLIGGGWSTEMTEEDCADLLTELQTGEVEVSHRNQVGLDVQVTP